VSPVPVFARRGVRLFCGDAREVAPRLDVDERTVVITDPVWPNSGRTTLAGREDPAGLFLEVIGPLVERGVRRLIIVLGCDSDPRFLARVPAALPFVRTTWLRLAVPSYKGRVLNGADVAHVFGEGWGAAFPGQRVWPGEIVASTPRARDPWRTSHPCPRRLEHVRGLLVGYCRGGDRVLDPFAGSCTTLAAAVQLGREADGIEIDAGHCAEAAARLADLTCDPAPSKAGPLFDLKVSR
jgi:site-specific DNA-methyltransferase (adenine-specific)